MFWIQNPLNFRALQFKVVKRHLIKQLRRTSWTKTVPSAKFKSYPQLRTRADLRNKQIVPPTALPNAARGGAGRRRPPYDRILQAPISTSFPLHQCWLNIIAELPYGSTLPPSCSTHIPKRLLPLYKHR